MSQGQSEPSSERGENEGGQRHRRWSSADAALGLGALIFAGILCSRGPQALLQAEWEPASESECELPVERAAHDGWTVDVACGSCPARVPAWDLPSEQERADQQARREPTSANRAALRPVRGPARLLFGQTLDINRVDARALEVLPGIGPARAAAIVAARSEAPFASLSELERIPGIGPKTVAGLARWAHAVRPDHGAPRGACAGGVEAGSRDGEP